MTIQSWVADKLSEDGLGVDLFGRHGLKITSGLRGVPIVAFVPEPGMRPFDVQDLEEALAEYGNLEAIVMIRRSVGPGVIEAASAQHVLIGPLGHIQRAIESGVAVAQFRHPDDVYLSSRLNRHPSVMAVTQVGINAWRIDRAQSLDSLTIVRHDRYEFPVDELHTLLGAHPGIELDAIVVTNPNASGFSQRVIGAATEVGLPIFLLDEFLQRLSLP